MYLFFLTNRITNNFERFPQISALLTSPADRCFPVCSSNPITPCAALPQLDLRKWKDLGGAGYGPGPAIGPVG